MCVGLLSSTIFYYHCQRPKTKKKTQPVCMMFVCNNNNKSKNYNPTSRNEAPNPWSPGDAHSNGLWVGVFHLSLSPHTARPLDLIWQQLPPTVVVINACALHTPPGTIFGKRRCYAFSARQEPPIKASFFSPQLSNQCVGSYVSRALSCASYTKQLKLHSGQDILTEITLNTICNHAGIINTALRSA